MQLGSYCVSIEGGRERDNGYVFLRHGDQYAIKLHNYSPLRSDATVKVDGKEVGTFRLNQVETIRIERPANAAQKFTFYETGTNDGLNAGLHEVEPDELGLVTVTFRPEREREEKTSGGVWRGGQHTNCTGGSSRRRGGAGGQSCTAGGTGLSGNSDQRFVTVGPLDYDRDATVTIHLRLVSQDIPQRLRSIRETPVPAPV